MADRPVLRRRTPSKPVEEEEEIVDDVDVEEDDEELTEFIEDADEEDEEDEEDEPVVRKAVAPGKKAAPVPAPVVAKKTVVAAPAKVVAPAPVVKKVAPPAPVAKVAKPVVKEVIEDVDDEEDVVEAPKKIKVKPVDATVAGSMMLELMENMEVGKAITITRTADDKWIFGTADAAKATTANGLRGKPYWLEVLDPSYLAWDVDWRTKTYDEKIKAAKKAGATWKEEKDPRVNILRATEAYRTAMGIEKYKPQYRTRAARAALQGK
jgi:hypothetical protein